MARELLVTLPEYYQTTVKPQNFADWCDMYDARDHGPLGLWCLSLSNRYTGEVTRELWTRNVIVDNGATAMLKNTWNNAGSAVSIFNQIAIGLQAGSTTLTTALTNGQTGVTSLAVQALPAAIPSGTTLTIGYGSGSSQTCVTSGTTSAGATSITISPPITANNNYAIGTNVVPSPTTSDNPSSSTGAQYSGALSSGAFAFSGSGAGSRQVVITYQFLGASTTAGNYTEAYTCNANPIVSGSIASHLITAPMAVNTSTNLTVTITEKV